MNVYFNDNPALVLAVVAKKNNASTLVTGFPAEGSNGFIARIHEILPDLPITMVDGNSNEYKIIPFEKEDIEAVAKRSAKAQFAQYGMLNVPEDILANYVEEMLKDKNGARNAAERAGENKVIAIIKENISIENKTVSFDEFNKFFEGK